MANDLETRADAELQTAEEAAAAQALADEFKAELSQQEFRVPMLVLVQATSRKPPEGSAPGDFVNTLTGTNHGREIEFVVSGFFKGRFMSNRDTGESWSAQQTDIVPDTWPEEYRGQRFSELLDAEEQYRERVRAGEIAWGHGPRVRTTWNFVGYVPGEEIPVRLSLMSASVPQAQKLVQLLRVGRAPWDEAVKIRSVRAESKKGEPYQGIEIQRGRPTEPEERQNAVALAQNLKSQRARFVGEDALGETRPEAPPAESALPL